MNERRERKKEVKRYMARGPAGERMKRERQSNNNINKRIRGVAGN